MVFTGDISPEEFLARSSVSERSDGKRAIWEAVHRLHTQLATCCRAADSNKDVAARRTMLVQRIVSMGQRYDYLLDDSAECAVCGQQQGASGKCFWAGEPSKAKELFLETLREACSNGGVIDKEGERTLHVLAEASFSN